jgi:hypothetical protein
LIWKPSGLVYFCPKALELIQPRSQPPLFPQLQCTSWAETRLLFPPASLPSNLSTASLGTPSGLVSHPLTPALGANHPQVHLLLWVQLGQPLSSAPGQAIRQQLRSSWGFTELVLMPSLRPDRRTGGNEPVLAPERSSAPPLSASLPRLHRTLWPVGGWGMSQGEEHPQGNRLGRGVLRQGD